MSNWTWLPMENLMLLQDFIRRYAAYRAEQPEQLVEAIDGIMDFEELAIKEANKIIQAQDPLKEVNLRDEACPRLTYMSKMLNEEFKAQLLNLLRKYNDCFSWDYHEMPGLWRDIVEH